MKLTKRIAIVVITVIVAVQLPFIYRRYAFSRTAAAIAADNAGRTPERDERFREFTGVIHAHTSLGGHSTATFDELISGASAAGLDFVVMTEHWSPSYDTAALTLNGQYGRTLFVGGNEIDTSTGDRFLMVPGGSDAASLREMPTDKVIDRLHDEGRLALVAYPERSFSPGAKFDGIEVFDLHTAATGVDRMTALFDMIWSGGPYSQLVFARNFERPADNLAKYDQAAAARPVTLFAGTDAHSNIGFHIFGDDAGHKLLNFKVDPYATMFSLMRTHVLLPVGTDLTRETLVDAIRSGRLWVGIDALGDSSGFSFRSGNAAIGDTIAGGTAAFTVDTPLDARIVLLKNGEIMAETTGRNAKFDSSGPGEYRIEAYRTSLGDAYSRMPWIMSDPIYIR